MSDISGLRQQIDLLDDEILDLLMQRFKIAEQVRDVKQQTSQPPLDTERWANIETRLRSKALESGMNPEDIARIFNEIHSYVLKNIYKEKA